ncbi:MAG: helix-turn-helix transcriptional regulator [bacterium]|nr:helix-turn-helix transcriptional regulator [bacterium]
MNILTMIKKQPVIFMSLLGFLVLSFILQKDFYTSKFGSISIGIFFLVLLEFAKINFEIRLFQKLEYSNSFSKWLSKGLIFAFCVVMIGFSFYATFKTISNYNQDSLNTAVKKRQAAIAYNKNIQDEKFILENQLSIYKGQLETNKKLLESYSNQPREYWQVKIKTIQKNNVNIAKKIDNTSEQLLAQSEKKSLFVPKIDNSTEEMHMIVMLFLAGFLDFGILFLAWNFTKISPKKSNDKSPVESTQLHDAKEIGQNTYNGRISIANKRNGNNNNGQSGIIDGQKLRTIRNNANMTQSDLAEILSTKQKTISLAENGEIEIEKDWLDKLVNKGIVVT